MATLLDYATLSAIVYNDKRDAYNILNNLPTGWTELLSVSNPGFTAGAYQNGNDIVIAFKGSDPIGLTSNAAADWIATNLQAGFGLGSTQLVDAALFYEAVKVANPGANITFTGHSLGGGLASVMSVWFDKQATTFDEAPFLLSAVNPAFTLAVEAKFLLNGIVDSDFLTFAVNPLATGLRSSNVQGHYVSGEFLNYLRSHATAIYGTDTPIVIGGGDVISSTDLHSINLAAALLIQNKFRTDTVALPMLLTEVLNTKLYAAASLNTNRRDFLTSLLNDQIRVGYDNVDGLLARFAGDIDKLTQYDANFKDAVLGKALIDVAIADYYFMQNGFSGKDFFNAITGGITFDLADIGANWLGNKATIRLDNAITQELNLDLQSRLFLNQDNAWSIQSGADALNVTGTGTNNDAMIGGITDDVLDGGAGSDFLYSGDGADTLTGGTGNDLLEGGIGTDTYIYHASDGFDTILDSDGDGIIQWDGQDIKGSNTAGLDPTKWKQLSSTLWKDEANNITYTLQTQTDGSQTLFIGRNGDELRVDKWLTGNLGITLGAGTTTPPAGNIYNGDQHAPLIGIEIDLNIPATDASYNSYKWSATSWAVDGSLTGGIVQANFNDVIVGSNGVDSINGFGGNDALDGGAGNDIIDGGIGDDLIGGGAGSDIIYGGAGNDMILSATGLNVPQRKGPGDVWQVPAGKIPWTMGSTWGIAGDANGYTIYGGGSLITDNAPDIIFAGDGDDRVVGGLGDDYIDGGLNNDTLTGQAGNDIIDGGDGNDYIRGDGINKPGFYETLAETNHGNDYLDGGSGDDILLGGGKNDVLFGGTGNDYLWGDVITEADLAGQYHGNDYLDGGDGNDQLVGGGKDDTLIGGAGNDMLFGDDTANNLAVQYHGNDYLDGGEGNDYLDGGSGDDVLLGGTGIDSLYGGAGNDNLLGGEGNDELHGGDDNDVLDGGADDDLLFGDAGNDTLDGGAGADQLYGGEGDDLYLNVTGEDTIDDTEGHNTIQLAQASSIGIGGLTVAHFGDQGQYLRLDIALDDGETLKIQNAFYGTDATLEFANGHQLDLETLVGTSLNTDLNLQLSDSGGKLYGGAGNDNLYGGSGADVLNGALGNDTLYGGVGNDTLNGGIGDDYLVGGAGKDTYVFNRGGGRDTIIDSEKDSSLIFGEGITASDITLRLGSLELDLGNGDQVHIDGFDLNDAFNSSSVNSFTFADGTQLSIEQLLARGFDLDGTNQNDAITGTNTADRINGLAGNDVLSGGAGNDTLDGGDGNDIINGGANDDTLIGGAGHDLLLGGAGNDVYQLDASSDTDEIADIQGQNVIRFAADLTLANLSADVSIIGGQSALLIKVNGADAATITYGWDNFSFEFADGSRMTSTEFLLNFRADAQTVYGDDTDNTLYGGKASDTLYGQGGNDTLWGGAGDDLLEGGLGSDDYRYRLGDGHDVIRETDDLNAGQSSLDRVIFGDGIALSDVSFYRQANGDLTVTVAGVASAIRVNGWYTDPASRVEAFVFANGQQVTADTVTALDVTPLLGSAANDTLMGTDYRDIIRAGNGDDVLIGNGGNDDLYGGTGTDSYQFSLGGGSDKVFEISGETSVIKVVGFELSRLTAIRVGNDMLLSVTGAGDTLTLKDFYTMSHDWKVESSSSAAVELSSVLADNVFHKAGLSEIDRLQENFIANSQDTIIQGFKAQGMMQQTDGSWQSPFQLSATQQTTNFVRASGYSGYVPQGSSYAYFNTSYLSVGTYSISTYSSDAAEINYSGGASYTSTMKNVQVAWGTPQFVFSSQVYSVGTYHQLYTLQEALAIIDALAVGGISNPYVYTETPQYTKISTATTEIATVLSVTPATGAGYDLNSGVANFNNLPNTLAVTASINNESVDVVTGGEGDNTIRLQDRYGIVHAGGGNDTIQSSANKALLDGGAGNDLITGSYGDDMIIGGSGNDVLEGGAGNDWYYFMEGDTGSDLLYDVGLSAGYGGGYGSVDSNTVVFGKDVALSEFKFSWGVESLPTYNWGSFDYNDLKPYQTLDITWQANSVVRIVLPRADEDGYYHKTGIQFFEFADGSRLTLDQMLALAPPSTEHAPVITTLLQDQIATEDMLFTFTLPANTFSDAVYVLTYSQTSNSGWLNFDPATRTFSGTPDAYAIYPSDVTVTATNRFGASVSDTFTLTVNPINRVYGTAGNDTLLGTAGADELIGLSGTDTLDGGLGADLLIGGDGNDTYSVDNPQDIIKENFNEGTDLVKSSVSYTLSDNVENLTLTGTVAIIGTGNELDNVLIGNSAGNTLLGGDGDDKLIGGAGADTLIGGTGNDTYSVDTPLDVITENFNEGTDLVKSSVSYILSDNVENLTLTGTVAIIGTGNELDNVLTGNSAGNTLVGGDGDDKLVGGAGADTLIGGTGNDTYIVDNSQDIIKENFNEGTDLVKSSVSYTLSDNVENLTLTGTALINGTGNTLGNVLTGNTAANTLIGGAGDDVYVIGTGDTVVEALNEGTDTVRSSITYTLGANLENLTLIGTEAIDGSGNVGNNTLIGNTAANTLTGGAGDDVYVIGTGDSVVEALNEGTDTVRSSITYTLGANLENLTLIGTEAIDGSGNVGNNTLIGNAAANTLNAGIGNDRLVGGKGNDTYILGRGYGIDTVFENDATAGNTDVAQFLSGVATDQIWLQHVSNNLEVSIIGTTDKLVIKDWYLGTANHVEQFKTTDGAKTLIDSNVQNLVNAMAAFAPPTAGQSTLPQNYQTALAPVIAANWQ